MTRARPGKVTKARHNKILSLAKGFRGRAKNCFRIAIEKVEKALQYAYRDRKVRKRDMRSMWIQRINSASREHGLTYATFIAGLKRANIEIDRKMLAEMAVRNSEDFSTIVNQAKAASAK